MKNLFVLMALAGLAAFQVGCGDSSPAPAAKPMSGPAGGANPGAPAADAGAKKDDDMPKEEAAAGDEKPAEEAAPTEEKEKKDE